MRVIDASCQISREFDDVVYKTRPDGAGTSEQGVVFEAPAAAEDTAETVGRAAVVSAEGVAVDAPDASEPVGEQSLPEEVEALQTTATAMKESEVSEDARAVPTFADALAPVSSYERRLAGLSGIIQGKERDNLLALTSSALTQQPGPGTAPTSSSSNSGLICIYTYTLSTSALKSVCVCKYANTYVHNGYIHNAHFAISCTGGSHECTITGIGINFRSVQGKNKHTHTHTHTLSLQARGTLPQSNQVS